MTPGPDCGAFVSGVTSRGTYKYRDLTDNGLGASVGCQVHIGTRWQLCPKLNVSHSSSTWLAGDTHRDRWTTSTEISAALGVTA